MIPVLHDSTSTAWETQGIGALSDAISCTVTEEKNGTYELEMEYPITGIHFEEIKSRCIIMAIPSPYRDPQPFRIYRITKPLNGVCTIYAQHLSYDLSGVPVSPYTAKSAALALSGLKTYAATSCPFEFWTDVSGTGSFAVTVPSSARSHLGGSEGSILDVFGGEYEFDKWTVKLYSQRGQDRGVTIRYGKNLTDLEQDQNISNVATGIYPYWASSDGSEIVTCDPKIVEAEGNFDFSNVVAVDFSSEWQEAPSKTDLKKRAETYIEDNKIGVPAVSITVSFIQLDQTADYAGIPLLERCDLCDTVTVQFEALGVDATAEIVKIETDVLQEKYNSVEMGDVKSTIADTIAGQKQELEKRPTTSAMQMAVENATSWITGTKGGYVIMRKNAEGQPYEILIMDTPDIGTAKKVWRWNNGGLGYSGRGYNGPYTTAITQDGAIVADFITTGTMNAQLIKSGVLQSQNGKFSMDMESGYVDMKDGNFSGAITWDGGSIKKANLGMTLSAQEVLTIASGARMDFEGTSARFNISDGGSFSVMGAKLFVIGYYNETTKTHIFGDVTIDGKLYVGGKEITG